jgi:transposase InsO family protein
MPWKTPTPMEQRHELVLLAKSGEFTVTELCKRFAISRKTAHKWIDRYEEFGPDGLADRSRAPKHSPQRTADEIEQLITSRRREHPTWGAKKLHRILIRDDALENPPAVSTIGEILKRNGLAGRDRRRPRYTYGTPAELTDPERANHVWAADYKGWFCLGNGSRCIPLTITDLHSRFVILLSADEVSTQAQARRGFERAFREFGLPEAIRVDNGTPFAAMAPGNLSKLSVWWTSHGIRVEFTRRGKPQDNGCHERMHRTLKDECCKVPKEDHGKQQKCFDRWREEFNTVRPHESLNQRTPSELYHRSNVPYDGRTRARLYEPGDEVLRVSSSGSISLGGHKLHVGEALQGTQVALDRLESGIIAVRYANVKLGEFLAESGDDRMMYPGYYSENRGGRVGARSRRARASASR